LFANIWIKEKLYSSLALIKDKILSSLSYNKMTVILILHNDKKYVCRVTLCENGGGLADISKNSRVFQDYMGES
jgi:hypothetical protein